MALAGLFSLFGMAGWPGIFSALKPTQNTSFFPLCFSTSQRLYSGSSGVEAALEAELKAEVVCECVSD